MTIRTKAGDRRVEADHGLCHALAGVIGVKAAVDTSAFLDERPKPGGVGPGSSCGEAAVLRMKSQSTDGVNGRLTKDDRALIAGEQVCGDGEEAEVFARTRSHASPMSASGSAKFGAHHRTLGIPE